MDGKTPAVEQTVQSPTWTFEELVEAMKQDQEWEVPAENRDWLLYGFGWTLFKL